MPVPKEFVMLEDSDEESETDCSEESEFEVDFSSHGASSASSEDEHLSVEERLEKMIGKSLNKFNLEYQFTAAEQNLYKR